jgi:hypothetical protein
LGYLLNIAFTCNEESVISIKIYDIVGKLIQNIANNISYQKGNHQINVDTHQLNKGIYIVKCIVNNQDLSYKILKN